MLVTHLFLNMMPILNKETTAIWNAWTHKGNREVVREAAAKGSHVNLATKFISIRNKMSQVQSESFFKKEVLIWVKELLDRKQIHKCKHILSNTGIQPVKELHYIFFKTESSELRKYLGDHLIELNEMKEKIKNLWAFLEIIQANNCRLTNIKDCNSIEDLYEKSEKWHSKVATILFLLVYDSKLTPFIKPLDLFKCLLTTNNESIKDWIAISFGKRDNVTHSLNDNLLSLFQENIITEEMLDLLNCEHMSSSENMIDGIFNELCKYGIFPKDERTNLVKLLRRFLNYDISALYDVLELSTSTVSIVEFTKMLNDYCVENSTLYILNECSKYLPLDKLERSISPHINLLLQYQSLQWGSEESIRDNIMSTITYIKDCDYKDYFEKNPLVLCSLLVLVKDGNFLDCLSSKMIVQGVDISKYFRIIPEKFNFVRSLFNRSENDYIYKAKTFYNLMEDHLKIKVERLFEFRFKGVEMPHFDCDKLVQKYGYSKSLDFVFYVKELRPSMAAMYVIVERIRQPIDIGDEILGKQLSKNTKIALNNFQNNELASSCICFQEMIGISSSKLRNQLNVAKVFYKNGYDELYCKNMFSNFENINEIQNTLESLIIDNIKFGFETAKDFIDAKNKYDLVIKFSWENDMKLPLGFLKNCAIQNDWFYFMVFAQIYKYYSNEIREAAQSFKNPFYLEHILHCITYDIQIDEENALKADVDYREAEHSRVEAICDNFTLKHNKLKSITKGQYSHSSQDDSSDSMETYFNNKTTLLQTLIRCHNSTDPPKALLQACKMYRYPLLAIFATCYEPDSIHTNWLTWLVVSCELCDDFTNLERLVLMAGSTKEVLTKVMDERFPNTLLNSFKIFLPDNSLTHFLEFLRLGIQLSSDVTIMSNELTLFINSLENCRKSNVFSDVDPEITYLINRCWIEETALALMASALEYNFRSTYNQILFLRIICKLKVQDIFCIEVPDFSCILDIMTFLFESNCGTRLNLSLVLNVTHHREAIVSCLNSLLDKKLFDTALKVAQTGNLPIDLVILMQWQDKFENRAETEKHFWELCNKSFKVHKVTADRVIEFYSNIAERLTDRLEKFEVSKLSYKWARDYQLSEQFNLERIMLLNYMSLDDYSKTPELLDMEPDTILYKDMLEKMKQVPICSLPLPKDCADHVNELISFALIKCNIFQALRLQKMFQHEDSDVEILKLCLCLAEGLQMPNQLCYKERTLLDKVSTFRRFNRRTLSSRLSSLSYTFNSPSISTLNSEESVDPPGQDILRSIQMLSEKLTKGTQIANDIATSYKLSIYIHLPYSVIITDPDGFDLLKNALEMDCTNKLEVVQDFVLLKKWNKNMISDLIFEELINHLNHHLRLKTESPFMWDLNLDNDFPYVLRLLPEECTTLGNKIYSYSRALFESHMTSSGDVKISELSFIIELLIKAHDCFTADCNMEGISKVLNKSRKIIIRLVTLRSWKLIVRMLTGVARYSEMTYVFHILKENEQFEFLLMKGSRQDSALKTALLEYLKKYSPDNRDLYKMVALHFALFSEVGLLWERDAHTVIKNLIEISKMEMQNDELNPDTEPYIIFTNTDGTRLCLSKAMEDYTYATEFHLQGEKLTKAMYTARQAELIAVQLSLFNGLTAAATATCILQLDNNQIFNLISSKLSFEQSLILVEAYNYSVDWSSVLFNQCVRQNNMIYLVHFLNHLPLTEAIIRDICRRFISNFNIITPEGTSNMKTFCKQPDQSNGPIILPDTSKFPCECEREGVIRAL
ncbi:hypothetical protein WA026_015154 [Henosepilachna vigintioctopunctata]|uniref:Spatacsin C-terminal domain-containing protein n=1 Tax=Henosepilachna vigintioctopunctata TaxID=420089 RepID=A0AAW1TTG3_9CUCU